MSELRPEPDDSGDDAPATAAADADAAPSDAAPLHRTDSLATGVAVLVMAALLACAAIVLIAAGNG